MCIVEYTKDPGTYKAKFPELYKQICREIKKNYQSLRIRKANILRQEYDLVIVYELRVS